jgi:hypothetical protein
VTIAQGAPQPAPREPYDFDPMPAGRRLRVVDERIARAPMHAIFRLAREVERWPALLRHYRWVRFRERARDGGGLVEMAAWRPFGPGPLHYPTWWVSEMGVQWSDLGGGERPRIRFRHVEGITRGMDVEWTFTPVAAGIRVRIVHLWDGPAWPVIGGFAATRVIGPVFIHGIAARTLAGLAAAAEQEATNRSAG